MTVFHHFRGHEASAQGGGRGVGRLISRASGWRALAVLSLAAIGVVGAVGPSSSATVDPYPGTVAVYTGCLNTSGQGTGAVMSLAASATTPAKPCGQNQTIIHVAGGTLTGITAGPGLQGGGTNGAPTIGIDPSFQLPQGCPQGDLVVSDPADGGYSCHKPGKGLQDDPVSKTLQLAGPYQLPQGCPAGQVPGSTGPGNDYVCLAPGTGLSSDSSTGTIGVNVGTGLSTDSSNNIGVAGSYQLPQGCTAGQIAQWTGTAWVCANENPTGLNSVYVQTAFITVTGTGVHGTGTVCNPGDIALSGGVDLLGLEGSVKLLKPVGNPPVEWDAQVNITDVIPGGANTVMVYAVCAKTG